MQVREAIDASSHPSLLLVDGVSSIAALDFQFDKWKVDVAVTGSQKGLSLPTGLAVIAISDKVWCCSFRSVQVQAVAACTTYMPLLPRTLQPVPCTLPLLHSADLSPACPEIQAALAHAAGVAMLPVALCSLSAMQSCATGCIPITNDQPCNI